MEMEGGGRGKGGLQGYNMTGSCSGTVVHNLLPCVTGVARKCNG